MKKILSTGNFICGASFIYSTKFYDPKIYPLDNISNIEDYPALLYMLLTEKKIGFFDFSTRWYEYGTGVSTSKASSKFRNRLPGDGRDVCPAGIAFFLLVRVSAL